MILFLSKYLNDIDKKGRTLAPISFCSIVAKQGTEILAPYPSIKNLCTEVKLIAKANKSILKNL
jgi:hypothetical protein